MRKGILLLLGCFAILMVSGQNASDCKTEKEFAKYLRCVIEGHARDEKEFPRPPTLTDTLISGVQREFKLHDSARYYLDNLSYYIQRVLPHREQPEQNLYYFFRKDCFYTLLALTVHWDPDTRIYATRELHKLISLSMLRNDQKLKTGARQIEYIAARDFLIYVLENTPWTISGSENATIHEIYLLEILNCLHLLFGENPPYNGSQFFQYSDKEIQNSINRWKDH